MICISRCSTQCRSNLLVTGEARDNQTFTVWLLSKRDGESEVKNSECSEMLIRQDKQTWTGGIWSSCVCDIMPA